MASSTRVRCKVCGRHKSEAGSISRRGKCGDCRVRLEDEHNDDLHYHRGPNFQKWRRAMAACVGAELLDDEPPAA